MKKDTEDMGFRILSEIRRARETVLEALTAHANLENLGKLVAGGVEQGRVVNPSQILAPFVTPPNWEKISPGYLSLTFYGCKLWWALSYITEPEGKAQGTGSFPSPKPENFKSRGTSTPALRWHTLIGHKMGETKKSHNDFTHFKSTGASFALEHLP